MSAADMVGVLIIILALFAVSLLAGAMYQIIKTIAKHHGRTRPAPGWMSEAERNGDIHDQ